MLFPAELNKSNRYLRDFLIQQFSHYIDLPHADFLEVGIGNGRFGCLLGEGVAHYYGIDVNEEYVRIAKTNITPGAKVTYKVGGAEEIPFEKQFDIVFYALSWHFIKDFQKALREAKRVLKPDGIMAILEPSENSKNWSSPKLRPDSPEFEEKLYTQKLRDLETGRKAILEQNTFEVVYKEYDAKTTLYFYILKKKE